ncbi:Protein of unknown function [Cotesia congregata]|uniref:Uncharacterized protein n=1 Tax=Cotesia congregata TaxID=51543 RepID=A0A8J2HEE7_COTCN|nr:Protein of unknown function [Cotesia congregata]
MSENSLNSVYLLGAVHNNLPSRKLPKNGDVLNYFMLKYKILKKTVRECAAEIIDEVQEIWSDMNTPLIKHQHAIKKMEMLFTEWRNLDKSRLKKHSEFHLLKIKKFTDKLNELFDVRLKKDISHDSCPEKLFSLVRRSKGRLTPIPDDVEDESFPLKPIENDIDENVLSQALSDTSISFEELSRLSSTSCSRAPKRTISNFEDELPQSSHENKIDVMTPELSSALDRSNVSSRNAAYIVIAVAKSLGHDPNKINVSHRSIHRDHSKVAYLTWAFMKVANRLYNGIDEVEHTMSIKTRFCFISAKKGLLGVSPILYVSNCYQGIEL